jgi:hypothetical protein
MVVVLVVVVVVVVVMHTQWPDEPDRRNHNEQTQRYRSGFVRFSNF